MNDRMIWYAVEYKGTGKYKLDGRRVEVHGFDSRHDRQKWVDGSLSDPTVGKRELVTSTDSIQRGRQTLTVAEAQATHHKKGEVK